MGLISVSLPADGTTADVADYNVPITTITTLVNGNISDANVNASAAIDGSKLGAGSIPAAKMTTAANPETRSNEFFSNFVASGGIWTGDSYGSTLNGSMTALVCYINGQRGTVSAVTARAFTASKDTYIDVLNSSGVFTLVYSTAVNNTASPALAANSLRIGIVVTAAASIAASTSIGQGGFANTSPVISSQILKGFDTLGNLIYPTGGATAAKLQNPYKFSVYRNAALNTPSATFALVPFDTKTFDTGSNVDVVTNKGRFTAPIAGFYWFGSLVDVNSVTSGSQVFIDLYKNGVQIARGSQTSVSVLSTLSSSISTMLQLAANDYVEIYVYGTAVFPVLTGSQYCYFQGYLVSTS